MLINFSIKIWKKLFSIVFLVFFIRKLNKKFISSFYKIQYLLLVTMLQIIFNFVTLCFLIQYQQFFSINFLTHYQIIFSSRLCSFFYYLRYHLIYLIIFFLALFFVFLLLNLIYPIEV